MTYATELESTVNGMVQRGRGILAADKSSPTIANARDSIIWRCWVSINQYWKKRNQANVAVQTDSYHGSQR